MAVDTARWLTVLLVSAATTASCGGGDGDPERSKPRSAQHDKAIADAGLLTRADLPRGWRPGPVAGIVGESSCQSVREIADSATSIARSRQLRDSYSTSTVANVVLTFSDDAAAERAFDTFMDDRRERAWRTPFATT